MAAGSIYLNGKITAPDRAAADLCETLSTNFIYQDIHVLDGKPLFLDRHLEIASAGCQTIHGSAPQLSADALSKAITAILHDNRYTAASSTMRLMLAPGQTMIIPVKQLLYKGFVLWHSRFKALSVQYELPFAGPMCSASLVSARTAYEYAVRQGADIAIRVNYDGLLTAAGDDPLFGVKEGIVHTTPPRYGAPRSVFTALVARLCEKAGIEMRETPLQASESLDEIFIFNPQGINSISELDGRRLFNTTANRLEESLPYLLNEPL